MTGVWSRPIVIVGHMGVGKSTTGRALATALDRPYSDSDDEIELLLGRSGREFAAEAGVPMLHQLEAAVLIGALARPVAHVVAAAGSVVDNELVRRLLVRNATVVHLTLSVEETIRRQGSSVHRRPMSTDELVELRAEREPRFAEVTDLAFDANLDTGALVAVITDGLEMLQAEA